MECNQHVEFLTLNPAVCKFSGSLKRLAWVALKDLQLFSKTVKHNNVFY